ncbi:MAG: hydroxymethylbilane synthase [Nitriliruptorales bacterium]|nr:hydroxymethylbilane synthase [Nitriliruptorales bacterium]
MSEDPWRIATRRSSLARAQAQEVADALSAATGRPAELVPMATTGDEHPDRAIESFDSKGLFVDATRQSVLDGDCHLVVHSYKDLPTEPAEGLTIGAVPSRRDPRDVLVTRDGHRLSTIPRGGGAPFTIGTSSARRRAQIQRARRDVLVQPLRGNLDTRLQKVVDGELDGIVIALAGLQRLGPEVDLRAVPLEHGECLHSPGQGALALECRAGDAPTRRALRKLDDPESRTCVAAERELMMHLGGGCTAPIGAHAALEPGGQLELLGMYADANGTNLFRASHRDSAADPRGIGRVLAASLLDAAGGVLHGDEPAHDAGQHRH